MPSAFVCPVVGEGLSTLTDFVQKSSENRGFETSGEIAHIFFSPESPLRSSELSLNVSCGVIAVVTLILSS